MENRAFTILNLKQYSEINLPQQLGRVSLSFPEERQYILRMFIKDMFGEWQIPEEIYWISPMLKLAVDNQKRMGIRQPFVYVTIRNGIVDSKTDDDWHVDGFSLGITHLPEQNYIWSNDYPTEYVEKAFDFPEDFDGNVHNIHSFFQKRIKPEEVMRMQSKVVYGLDPYVVHRRPAEATGKNRCFVRISFTPIEIRDKNNSYNPLIPTAYKRDGIVEKRNLLIDYDVH